ncbi:MAG: hypothetical protein AAF597_12085, partial [Bacteroidota bacterium]
AQSTPGKLQATAAPDSVMFRIDGTVYSVNNTGYVSQLNVELAPGAHTLELWHPYFNTYTDTIMILSGETTRYNHSMQGFNAEYLRVREELTKPKGRQVLTILGTGLVNITGWLVVFNYDKVLETTRLTNLERVREVYNTSISAGEIAEVTAAFNAAREEVIQMQRNRNTRRAIGIPVMVGLNVMAAYLYRKNSRNYKKIKGSFRQPPPFSFQFDFTDHVTTGITLKF